MVDWGGIDECRMLHDVHDSVTHFDLNAHLEPLVVNVEARTKFGGEIEAFRDQVVDKLVAEPVGFLIVFLRGKVEFWVDATHDVSPDIVVTLRAVLDVERKLNEGSSDGFGDGFHVDVAVFAFHGDVVLHPSLAEAERGDETQVEIAAKSLAADDAHGEARSLLGLNVVDIKAFRVGWAVVAIGPRVGGLGDVLVVLNGFDGIAHLVESQQKTEMIRLLFVFGQIMDDAPLGLHGHCQNGEQQHNGGYFQCFFQDEHSLFKSNNAI